MPAITAAVNVNEAKSHFSRLVAEVESRLASFTIMRSGHPVARLVPIEPVRKIRPLPVYGRNIAIKGDLFSDDLCQTTT